MKNIFLLIGFLIFTKSTIQGQNIQIGLISGLDNTFSHDYKTRVEPLKTYSNLSFTYGVSLNYIPFKKENFFIYSGLIFSTYTNAFQLEGSPQFSHKEGFQKIENNYTGIKVPIRLGYKHNISNKFGLQAMLGCSYLNISRDFTEGFNGDESVRINQDDYTLSYALSLISIYNNSILLDSGVGVSYKMNNNIVFELSLIQQLGTKHIVGSRLDYNLTNNTIPFESSYNAYLSTKGDALSFLLGVNYVLGK